MDFSFSEEHHDLAGLTRQILTDRATNTHLREIERGADRFDRSLWTELARADVLSAALPKSADGGDLGLIEQCGILAEIGRTVAPVPYLPSITVAASAIAQFGDQHQQASWAAPAGTGEVILTAALSEQDTADPRQPSTTAEYSAGSWKLNGTKANVPAAGIANLFLVSASTPSGSAVFLVRPEDSGVALQRQEIVDFDSEGLITLTDVELGPDRLLGEAGGEALDWLITRATVGLCALQLGVVERAVEMTSEYARERVQFGRPIGSFQAVAQRMADAYIDVEAVRLTMWQAAWRVSEGLAADADVATAKFWASEAGHRVAYTAVHVHGGVGIDLDHHLHRYFVAAKRNEFSLGASTAQLRRLGDTLAAESM